MINRTLAAGFADVEIGAIVPPRTNSHFADMAEVFRGIDRYAGVRTRVLTPNSRGLKILLEMPDAMTTVDDVGIPVSASESHNASNLKKTINEQLAEIAAMAEIARSAGLGMVVAVATAFGCPIEGHVDSGRVLELADRLADLGIARIMLSDSTGLGDPLAASRLFSAARERLPHVELIAHFHDTRARGLANTLAAIAAGVTNVESSLGGIGGEPPWVETGHVGETGNLCTEDLVSTLAQMNVETGVGPQEALELGRGLEELLGCALRSSVLRSGLGLFAASGT